MIFEDPVLAGEIARPVVIGMTQWEFNVYTMSLIGISLAVGFVVGMVTMYRHAKRREKTGESI